MVMHMSDSYRRIARNYIPNAVIVAETVLVLSTECDKYPSPVYWVEPVYITELVYFRSVG